MKYFGTITGLGVPAATPAYLPPAEDDRQKPDHLPLLILCAVGAAICVGLVVLVGRRR